MISRKHPFSRNRFLENTHFLVLENTHFLERQSVDKLVSRGGVRPSYIKDSVKRGKHGDRYLNMDSIKIPLSRDHFLELEKFSRTRKGNNRRGFSREFNEVRNSA